MKMEIIISADTPTKHSAASTMSEINRLHAEAQQLTGESRRSLDAALTAAWRAGKLLIVEKASIRRHAGRGAWLPWLKTCFHGGVRTAQRYMQFARRVDSPDALCGLGLRQAYLRLGISMSSKTSHDPQRIRPLKRPTHAMLAAKLIRLLRNRKHNGSKPGSLIHPSPELDTLYTLLSELYKSTKCI